MNKTYDEVDIGRRSPDDSFGGSRIHWENSPPSSSLIRSQWQISGSYRGYLIMSLHSGGGLLPTINRKFTTFLIHFKALQIKPIIFLIYGWINAWKKYYVYMVKTGIQSLYDSIYTKVWWFNILSLCATEFRVLLICFDV